MPIDEKKYRYLGNFSAVDPVYSKHMECFDCGVSWTGCWDNFQCPECGEGNLQTYSETVFFADFISTGKAGITRVCSPVIEDHK